MLHAGGKFGGEGYKVSGGLHGVGVSVVNALSRRVEVEIDRDGKRHYMEFADGGKLETKLDGRSARRPAAAPAPPSASGPTRRSSTSTEFRAQTLLERFQMMAFLNKGLEIRFTRRAARGHDHEPVVYKYAGGIIDFVKHVNASKEALFTDGRLLRAGRGRPGGRDRVPVEHRATTPTASTASPTASPPSRAACTRRASRRRSPTSVNKYARAKGLLKEKDDEPPGRGHPRGPHRHHLGAAARPAVRGPDQGQARQRLDALAGREGHQREAGRLARGAPDRGQARSCKKAHRRPPGPASRPATPATPPAASRRSTARACPTSSRTARSRNPRRVRAVHRRGRLRRRLGHRGPRSRAPWRSCPIRGKILNVERARIDKMLKNTEIQALISAIGAGVGEEFDVDKIRYHKVILLCDADVDGSHIRTLLLTFFFRQMKDAGRARARLHRPAAAVLHRGGQGEDLPQGRRGQGRVPRPSTPTTRRSSSASRAWARWTATSSGETTMDADRRTLLQVDVEQAAIADEVFSDAHGRRRREPQALHPDQRQGRALPRHLRRRTDARRRHTPDDDRRRRPPDDGDGDDTGTDLRRRSSRSRSRRRWSGPSSTTPCRSSSSRALPDVRDGLKPVHRRILWGMHDAAAPAPTGPP